MKFSGLNRSSECRDLLTLSGSFCDHALYTDWKDWIFCKFDGTVSPQIKCRYTIKDRVTLCKLGFWVKDLILILGEVGVDVVWFILSKMWSFQVRRLSKVVSKLFILLVWGENCFTDETVFWTKGQSYEARFV